MSIERLVWLLVVAAAVCLIALLFVAPIEGVTTAAGVADSSAERKELAMIARRNAEVARLRSKLQAIVVSDGIDRKEALVIAEAYFLRVGCGGLDGVSDGGGYWRVEGLFGAAGKRIKGFRIDKITGRVTSTIGKSYANPLDVIP